jgi:epoxyqueuosine reductase QueG
MNNCHESLKNTASENRMALFGIAKGIVKFYADQELISSKLPNAVVMGFRLSKGVLSTIDRSPTLIYMHHYRQVNNLLDRTALMISRIIEDSGFRAIPVGASQVSDWENQRGHISHRHIAEAAGLGWIGRNNLLVTRNYGSQVRLVSILTDMPFKEIAAENPASDSGCGKCVSCISACPVSAIKRKKEDFDFHACCSKLAEFSRIRGIGQHVCGICVKACPGTGANL